MVAWCTLLFIYLNMQKEIKINSEVQGIKDWVMEKMSDKDNKYIQFWDVCDKGYEDMRDAYQSIPIEYILEISPAKATNQWFIKWDWRVCPEDEIEYGYANQIVFANSMYMPNLGGDGMAMMYDIY